MVVLLGPNAVLKSPMVGHDWFTNLFRFYIVPWIEGFLVLNLVLIVVLCREEQAIQSII